MRNLSLADPALLAGQVTSLLLESFPARAAYSLRQLRGYYYGPVVRVRRASDNVEQDFFAYQITDGSLTTFCASTDGFIRTWYDQTGNGIHGIQTTAVNQPQIVSSGSLITQAGKPAISFTGGLCRLTANSLANRNRFEAYIVKNTADTNYILLNENSNNYGFVATSGSTSSAFGIYGSQANGTPTLYANNVLFSGNNRGQVYTFLNGYKLEVHDTASTNNWSTFTIGGLAGSSGFDYVGTIQELIFYTATTYSSTPSANRSAIQQNINSYYGIY